MDPLQETEVEICGKTYKVRPTFKIVAAIEGATEKSCVVLGRRLLNMEAPVAEIATVLYCMAADQKGPSVEQIGASLIEKGSRRYRDVLSAFLLNVYLGDEEMKKEAAASPQSPADASS